MADIRRLHLGYFTRPDDDLYGCVVAAKPDGHNNVYDFLIHLWSRGGRLLEADGTPLFGSPAGLSALSFLYELWCVDDVIDPRDEQSELVAAESRHGVSFSNAAADALGYGFEQAIAGGVAEGVVDVFEAIEVEEEDRQLLI